MLKLHSTGPKERFEDFLRKLFLIVFERGQGFQNWILRVQRNILEKNEKYCFEKQSLDNFFPGFERKIFELPAKTNWQIPEKNSTY